MRCRRRGFALLRAWSLCSVAGLVLVSVLTAANSFAEALSDPYQILGKHYEAMGGLAKIKAEHTRYFEATLSVYGLVGTVKEWEQTPIQKRQEVDLKVFKQTSGDNGDFSWVVDQNGKLQIQKDETTLKKRQVDRVFAAYDHMNHESKNFVLTLEGTEKVGTGDCYVVKIANTINKDYRLLYISTSNFYLEKMTLVDPTQEIHTLYSDYRQVAGIMIPFRQDSEILPIGQKQTIELAKYESNIEIDPALFQPPKEDVQDFQFVNGESAEDIPFQYLAEHVFLEVTVNCDKRLWCLDTGAGASVIDPAYASTLGLQSAGTLKASGAGQTIDASFVTLPPYSIQGIQFNEQQIASIDISGLFKKAGMDVVGILGYDFLSRFVTRVDYANRKISFYNPATFEYKGGGKVLDAPLKNNIFTLPMSVDGKYSGTWSLDLGAGGTSFFYAYAEQNQLLERKGVEALAGGAGGYFKTVASKHGAVDIAGFGLSDQIISVPVEKGIGAFGMSEDTGNIGNDLLRHFVLYLDYKHQRLIFEKGSDFGRDFPRGKSGLGLIVADTGNIEVFYISPGTPAETAGFKQGDVVKSINGIPVERFAGLVAMAELFKENAGTKYKMEVSREGKAHSITLKLRDLF